MDSDEVNEYNDKNRYHLKTDINDNNFLQKINAKNHNSILNGFDKIIVDLSTIRFIRGDVWDTLHQMLSPNDESKLITEINTMAQISKKQDSILTCEIDVKKNYLTLFPMHWMFTKKKVDFHKDS